MQYMDVICTVFVPLSDIYHDFYDFRRHRGYRRSIIHGENIFYTSRRDPSSLGCWREQVKKYMYIYVYVLGYILLN
jgi:hypothetical protein